MGVFYFPRRTRRFLLLLFSGLTLVAAGTLKHRKEIPAGSGYRRVEGYPPLVYLPGYTGGPAIRAGAAILVEEVSGMILYAKNEHQRRAPASTTKILTAIVALERGDLEDVVTVSRRPPGRGLRQVEGGRPPDLRNYLKGYACSGMTRGGGGGTYRRVGTEFCPDDE